MHLAQRADHAEGPRRQTSRPSTFSPHARAARPVLRLARLSTLSTRGIHLAVKVAAGFTRPIPVAHLVSALIRMIGRAISPTETFRDQTARLSSAARTPPYRPLRASMTPAASRSASHSVARALTSLNGDEDQRQMHHGVCRPQRQPGRRQAWPQPSSMRRATSISTPSTGGGQGAHCPETSVLA